MRNILTIVLTVFLAVAFSSQVSAEDGPAQKLSRGVVNILTAPAEIPREIRAHWIEGSQKTDHILIWIFSGFIKGTVNTVARVSSGIWDAVSFPFELPKDYRPLAQPDYVFDDWPKREGNK